MFCILVYLLSLLCPCRIVPRCICLVCYALVECLSIQVTCPVLVNLYVLVFIPSVNEHCDHYLVVFTWLIKPWFVSYSIFAWSHTACFICIYNFLLTMIMVYCCVSGVLCSYGSSASQLLELGVSEFCSTVPNSHVKSRVCFRVLSRNSQRGRL